MTMTVDIINSGAVDLLRDMERLDLIHLNPTAENPGEGSPKTLRSPDEVAARRWGADHRLSPKEAIEKCAGIAQGVLGSDEFLEMRRKDRELENAKSRRLFHKERGGL